MRLPIPADKLISDAHSFQDMLVAAKTENPAFANVLLGNVTSAATTQTGAVLAGAITMLSAHYGFGWSGDTVNVVAGLITLAAGVVIHWAQVWRYRRTLPTATPAVVPPPPKP